MDGCISIRGKRGTGMGSGWRQEEYPAIGNGISPARFGVGVSIYPVLLVDIMVQGASSAIRRRYSFCQSPSSARKHTYYHVGQSCGL